VCSSIGTSNVEVSVQALAGNCSRCFIVTRGAQKKDKQGKKEEKEEKIIERI
jgi:hypothetical protein